MKAMPSNKVALRQLYRHKRQQLSPKEIESFSNQILEQLKSMPIWDCKVYHLFVPIVRNNEINTFPLMDFLFDQGKTVVVPKMKGVDLLNCAIDQKVVWETGNFGVLEPKACKIMAHQEIEVVFVPMFIGDKKGHRVGYGGGFYDRFLAKLPKKSLKIGLSFYSPIDEIEAIESTDIPLDYCVSPNEIVSFTA